MIADSSEVCAARRSLLAREVAAYAAARRKSSTAGRRVSPRPAPVAPPPDAVIEIRIVGRGIAVHSERHDALVRSRSELAVAVLRAIGQPS